MAAGGRYKLSKRISLNMDYGLVTNRPEELNYNNMLSIGLDIETGGHVFQLHFTNSRSMLEHSFLTEASGDWLKGTSTLDLISVECLIGSHFVLFFL